jgi:hypothetical protein
MKEVTHPKMAAADGAWRWELLTDALPTPIITTATFRVLGMHTSTFLLMHT